VFILLLKSEVGVQGTLQWEGVEIEFRASIREFYESIGIDNKFEKV
jgi:hypothetical protein